MTKLSLLTWNVFWGIGAPMSFSHHFKMEFANILPPIQKRDYTPIMEIIATLSPDITCLQECEQAKRIMEETHHDDYFYAHEKTLMGRDRCGNAILGKNLQKKKEHIIPAYFERRNCISSVTKIGGKEVVIITTHLAAFDSNWRERKKQFQGLLQILSSFEGKPVILTGDFNCGAGWPEFEWFLERCGLRMAVHGQTFSTYHPQHQFDHVLVSEHFKVEQAQVLDIPFSDHFPIYAELELK